MRFKSYIRAVLCGLGEIAFSGTALSGLLVLAATCAIAPWSALGALLGSIFGTLSARIFRTYNPAEWAHGMSGYNPAILGLFWGGMLARGGTSLILFAVALVGCALLDKILKRVFAKIALPPLALAAVSMGWVSDLVLQQFNFLFWLQPQLLPLGNAGLAAAILLVSAALGLKSWSATAQTVVLGGATALLSGLVFGIHGFGPAGLWAFAVAPAVFAVAGVFAAGTAAGAVAAIGAGLTAALIWSLWVASPLVTVLYPLIMPCFAGIWLTILLTRQRVHPVLRDPNAETVAKVLAAARAAGRPAVALTGAGISTASGIPDYISGAWLDPEIPTANYGYSRFLASETCRRQYWDACHQFRALVTRAAPNLGHAALAGLARAGYVDTIITQNVDGFHHTADTGAVVELHGNISSIRCTECNRRDNWPRDKDWQETVLRCESCNGLMKPAVVALEENLFPGTWDSSIAAVERCGVLLVIGTQVAITTASGLLAEARRNGAKIIFVTLGPVSSPVLHGDIVVNVATEEFLPALCAALDCAPVFPKARPTRAAAA